MIKTTLNLLSILSLLIIGVAILAISLFSANRKQATELNQVTTETILNVYRQRN